jgi:hypothetical protein
MTNKKKDLFNIIIEENISKDIALLTSMLFEKGPLTFPEILKNLRIEKFLFIIRFEENIKAKSVICLIG